jgi:hypothetical protein
MHIHMVAAICCLVLSGLALAAQPCVGKAETDAAGSPIKATGNLKFGRFTTLTGAVAMNGIFDVKLALQPADAAVFIGGRGQRR